MVSWAKAQGGCAIADVFISYAKPDRGLAVQLAAMLEAEGWTVWWDTSLSAGNDFRDVIMTELARARAVLVIWTEASVASDWVRSEAGRAHADRKLIPVKTGALTYGDLPPPFDVLHTENIANGALVRAAVVAQLAKPAVEQSPWQLLTKGVRHQVLTWVGIAGGALTLCSNMASVLVLADWAHWAVMQWSAWTRAAWGLVLGWAGLRIPQEWVPTATFAAFALAIAIGQRMAASAVGRSPDPVALRLGPGLLLRLAGACVLTLVALFCVVAIAAHRYPEGDLAQAGVNMGKEFGILFPVLSGLLVMAVPTFAVIAFRNRNPISYVAAALLFVCFCILALLPHLGSRQVAELGGMTVIISFPPLALLALAMAPARAFSLRLLALGLVLSLFLALNQLSTLALRIKLFAGAM